MCKPIARSVDRRYYVQLRNGLPKIRIRAEFGTKGFDGECDAAIASQIALYGDATDHINAQKQRNEPRGELPAEPPKPHTLRWYWTLYKQSDHWLGDLSVGHEGLSDSTRLQRTGLVESLLPENGEKPFVVLTRKVIKEEMKARTPSQAGSNFGKKCLNFNKLSVGMVRSEGLEPPRFYSLPPQGSASTNSATSAWDTGWNHQARRIDGADVTNHRCRDKALSCRINYLTPGDFGSICLTSTAIRLRSTRTTPLAIGRLLARILTSSASVASSSMMAPRDSRIT